MATTSIFVPTNISSLPVKYNFSNGLCRRSKSRIILHSSYDYTDVHPINIAPTNRQTNLTPTPSFSKISPEKLIERSQQLRLSRLSTHLNAPLPSISTVDHNTLKVQQNTSVPIIARHQSLPRVKTALVDVDQRAKSRMSNALIARHSNSRQADTHKPHVENQNDLPWIMNEEFRQYIKQATIKCADWLMRNNFEETDELTFV